jgi:hypothetical protein
MRHTLTLRGGTNGEWDFVDSPNEEDICPQIQMVPDISHKSKEEWERDVLGFKQEEALAWADSLLAEAKRFEMAEQVPDENGEKRDNDLHMGCKSVSLGGNRRKLVSHRMAAHEAGAEYGIFVDIEATSADIKVTAIKVAAHGLSNSELAWETAELNFEVRARLEGNSDPLSISLFVCEGTSLGKELNESAWEMLGHEDNVTLPRINGKEDWEGQWREQWKQDASKESFLAGEWIYPEKQEPIYQRVPMDREITLHKGERKGFLIHSSCEVGVANRWPPGLGFALGEETDADKYVRLFAMRAQPEAQPFTQEEEEAWVHPCTGERYEPTSHEHRKCAHAFVGEIEYTVVGKLGEGDEEGSEREDGGQGGVGGGQGGEEEEGGRLGEGDDVDEKGDMLKNLSRMQKKVERALHEQKTRKRLEKRGG